MWVILVQATEVIRDERGYPTSWRNHHDIATFKSLEVFENFVKNHIAEFYNIVAFTGGATLLEYCNSFIVEQAKGVEVK